MKLGDRSKLSEYLTDFDMKLTRFQHRCAEGKSSDKLELPFLMKDLVLNDGFKVATLLSTLPEELDNQVDLITLRDLSYQEVRDKLSKIATKDQLKQEEKNRNNNTTYTVESTSKKKVKDKAQTTKINTKPKKNASMIECNYYKKYYPTTK